MKKKLKPLGPAGRLIQKGWCQKVMARNKQGHAVGFLSHNAVCFCSLGAIRKAYSDFDDCRRAVACVCKALGRMVNLSAWNDDPKRTKRQVLAVFRKVGV